MSDTPRVDVRCVEPTNYCPGQEHLLIPGWIEFARTLERELNAALLELIEVREECNSAIDDLEPVLRELGTARERIAELSAEVKEWLCVTCKIVYPGPPKLGSLDLLCPKCGSFTAPKASAELRLARERIAELERTIKAITDAYDAYRARGVMPGLVEYHAMVTAIDAARAKEEK